MNAEEYRNGVPLPGSGYMKMEKTQNDVRRLECKEPKNNRNNGSESYTASVEENILP
ncbi:hypothetical protein BSG1_00990 [Bacillus sp. SG-1]|nr:hypothetical protein BSG1_00990 [Bacillus sp. SG-1]